MTGTEGAEGAEAALAALKALPERTRDVFVLHRFEDMTYTQIAALLGLRACAVERHMRKALAAVCEALEGAHAARS